MKAKQTATMIIVAAFILAASSALAGPGQWGGRGSGGWGMDTPYQRLYDPAKEETFSGEVIGLEQTTPMRRMNQGMALIMKTDQETVTVHLGPGIWNASIPEFRSAIRCKSPDRVRPWQANPSSSLPR